MVAGTVPHIPHRLFTSLTRNHPLTEPSEHVQLYACCRPVHASHSMPLAAQPAYLREGAARANLHSWRATGGQPCHCCLHVGWPMLRWDGGC